jgi:hypothetical protein
MSEPTPPPANRSGLEVWLLLAALAGWLAIQTWVMPRRAAPT